MPIYEYRCQECEQIFEEWQKDFEERDADCPVCGNKAQRIMSNTTFVLKGSGWYVTDYAPGKASTSNGGAASPQAKADTNGGTNGNGKAKTEAASTPKADAAPSKPKTCSPAASTQS